MEKEVPRTEVSPTIHQRLMNHRIADARWRSNLANCYKLLKEVILNKSTWDPSTHDCESGRISKVKILNETAAYIQKLESMIIEKLKPEVILSDDTVDLNGLSFNKICSDFLELESSLFVNKKAVGPYVEEYLQLLAMDEFKSSTETPFLKEDDMVSLKTEDQIELMKIRINAYYPSNDVTMWQVPSALKKNKKRAKKPTVINLVASRNSLRTPICSQKRKSHFPQKVPLLKEKDYTTHRDGRSGVKRRLLDEMNSIEIVDLENENLLDTTFEMNSSQYFINNDVDQNVPVNLHPQLSSKIFSEGSQEVPGSYFENNLASEVEILTTEPVEHKEPKFNRMEINLSSTSSLKKPWMHEKIKKRTILGTISEDSNVQEVPKINKAQKLRCKTFTVLKTLSASPNITNPFVKFSPIHGDSSPESPNHLLTLKDPSFYNADPAQYSSPVGVEFLETNYEESHTHIYTSPSQNLVPTYTLLNDY